MRGMLREYGIDVPVGIQRGKAAAREALELADNEISNAIRPCIQNLLQEVDELQAHMKQVERTLAALSKEDSVVQRQLLTPGVGLLTATAMRAGVIDVQRFPTARHFMSDPSMETGA